MIIVVYIEFKYGSKVEQASNTNFLLCLLLLGLLYLGFFLGILLLGRGGWAGIAKLFDFVAAFN
jgi:hypothetical protein